jgi:ABC-type multidrug transport system fused ATPase/permease subunit
LNIQQPGPADVEGAGSDPERIKRYVSYWEREPDTPKTIGILDALLSKIVTWRPEESDLYVRNRIGTSEGYYFENYFQEKDRGLLKTEEVAQAFASETRTRLYKTIHYGSFLDHLFPVEARAYWKAKDRIGKIVAVATLYALSYLFLIVAVNYLFGGLTVSTAMYQTYSGPLKTLVRDEIFREEIKNAVFKVPEGLEPCKQTVGEKLARSKETSWLIGFNRDCKKALENKSDFLATQQSRSFIWSNARVEDRIQAVVAILAFDKMLPSQRADPPSQDFEATHLFSKQSFVITPTVNFLELATQSIIVFTTILVLNFYMTRKIVLLDVLQSVKETKRPSILNFAEVELVTYLKDRRSYNFVLSLTISIVMTIVLYYFVSYSDSEVSSPEAELIGLRSYDYRLSNYGQPTYVVYWALQFAIIFSLHRIATDVTLLNQKVRRVQRKAVQLLEDLDEDEKKSTTSAINSIFGRLHTDNYTALGFVLLILVALFGLSLSKVIWNSSVSNVQTFIQSFPSFVAYAFSPFVLVSLCLVVAYWPSYPSVKKASDARRRRARSNFTLKDAGDLVTHAADIAENAETSFGFLARISSWIKALRKDAHK